MFDTEGLIRYELDMVKASSEPMRRIHTTLCTEDFVLLVYYSEGFPTFTRVLRRVRQ